MEFTRWGGVDHIARMQAHVSTVSYLGQPGVFDTTMLSPLNNTYDSEDVLRFHHPLIFAIETPKKSLPNFMLSSGCLSSGSNRGPP